MPCSVISTFKGWCFVYASTKITEGSGMFISHYHASACAARRAPSAPQAGGPMSVQRCAVAVDIKLLGCTQGQGKGARPTEKCGVCVHCTRPRAAQGLPEPHRQV